MNNLFIIIQIYVLVSCKSGRLSSYSFLNETNHSSSSTTSISSQQAFHSPSEINNFPSIVSASQSQITESPSPNTGSPSPITGSPSPTSKSASTITESPSPAFQSPSPTTAFPSDKSTSLSKTHSSKDVICMSGYIITDHDSCFDQSALKTKYGVFVSTVRALLYSQFDESKANDYDAMFNDYQHCLLNAGNTAKHFGISVIPYNNKNDKTHTYLKVIFCCAPIRNVICNNKSAGEMIEIYKNEIACYKLAHPNLVVTLTQLPDCGDGGASTSPLNCQHELHIDPSDNRSDDKSVSVSASEQDTTTPEQDTVKQIIHIILAVFGTLVALLLILVASISAYACYRRFTARDREAQKKAIDAAKRSADKRPSNEVSRNSSLTTTTSTDDDETSTHTSTRTPFSNEDPYKENPVVYIDNTPPDMDSPSPAFTPILKPPAAEQATRTIFD